MGTVRCAVGAVLVAGISAVTQAGVVVYEKDGRTIEVGGRIQVQYVSIDPDCPTGVPCLLDEGLSTADSSIDELNLRRLRPYIAGSLSENWYGKIEVDFGQRLDANETQIKDAYLEHSIPDSSLKILVGNAKPPFSREFLTSSIRLQMVERTFVGDHNFGSLDRMLGVRLLGKAAGKKIGYGATVGMATHDPDSNRLDFDSPVNNQSDWNEGRVAAARLDFQPLGEVPFVQADFDREAFKFAVSVGGFVWNNDGDNNTWTDATPGVTDPQAGPVIRTDLDESTGLELSGAVRGHGLSVDLAYHVVSADLVDPTFTGGLYRNGTTDLDMKAITAGYMFVDDRWEVTASWDALDADNYQEEFTRTTAGLNYYFRKHDLKLQGNYRFTQNFLGLNDQDQNLVLAMMTYAF